MNENQSNNKNNNSKQPAVVVVDMTGEVSETSSTQQQEEELDIEGGVGGRNKNTAPEKYEENNVIVAKEEEEEEKDLGEDVAMLEQPLGLLAATAAGDNNNAKKNNEGNDIIELSSSSPTTTTNLKESMYSIIYIANPNDQAFYFGILIFLIQASLPTLVLINLIDIHSADRIHVPADVDKAVHAAGYFALLLSIPYFPDLLDAIEIFHEGYHPIVLKQSPYATKSKWFLAATLQLLFGLLFQFVIFLLIVQSTDVIGMFLNFAALGFITEIDDVAYSLIDRGYFSEPMKQICDDVKNHKIPVPTKGPWLRRFALLFFILVVVIAYSIIYAMQDRGDYACTRIEAQFGDDFSTQLPLYSGSYFVDKTKWRRKDSRLVYLDEQSNGQASVFRYCHNSKAWVFGLFDNPTKNDNNVPDEDDLDELCKQEKWMLNSPSTKSYDLLGERAMDWTTRKQDTQQQSISSSSSSSLSHPVDHLVLSCFECNDGTCNVLGGTCEKDSRGHDYCHCKEGFIGNRCQYNVEEACDYIDYDHRYDPFPDPIPSRFELVRHQNGTLYDFRGKAVYAHVLGGDDDDGNNSKGMFLLAFMGRRYLLLFDVYGDAKSHGNVDGRFENSTADTIVEDYLEFMNTERQHGSNSNYFPFYISEPLDVGTSEDRLIPTDLSWYIPTKNSQGEPVSVGAPVTTRLLCGTCNHKVGLYCEISGKCNTDTGIGECVCKEGIIMNGDGAVGPLCELYVSNITQWHEKQRLADDQMNA